MLPHLERSTLGLLRLAALGCFNFNGVAMGAENLLRNAGFEATASGRPEEWQSPPGVGVQHAMESGSGRRGGRATLTAKELAQAWQQR